MVENPETENSAIEENKPKAENTQIKDELAPIVSDSAGPSFAEPVAKVTPLKAAFFPAPMILVSIVLLAAVALVAGSWYARHKSFALSAPVLSEPFSLAKLSTNGKVYFTVLTPDGKNVIYTNGSFSEKQSIWIRQLDDGSSVELIPPSDEIYFGLALSPDGKILYFARRSRQTGEPINIYRVSIFGGIPQKIIDKTEGWISISPDGKQISFVRCPYGEQEYCSLWIADAADGGNERKLVSRSRPFRIGDNQISPDGKRVAFAVGQSQTAANEFGIAEVDLETGAEKPLSGEKFFNIKSLRWLPDESGLLLTASRVPNKNFLIWQVSAATGEVMPLTKDSETYSALALDAKATSLLSTQVRQDFRLRLMNLENPSIAQKLADASSANYASDGRIYFSSAMSGNDEIWSVNPDGGNLRQLTNNTADEVAPVTSPDSNSVFFLSNRTGAAQIWRMNPDGSNQTQITRKEGGTPLFVSPDSEWIYYRHGLSTTLWRVSVKTGEEQFVLDKVNSHFAFSPDGAQVAFSEKQGDERVLSVVSIANRQTVKTFPLPEKKVRLINAVWLPDGKNLAYVTSDQFYGNNVLWIQPLDDKEKPRQIAALGDEEMSGLGLSVSPDGKTFALVQGTWLHDAVLLKGLR
jgi:TolB protein